MKIFVVGLSHETAPVEIRERLSFSPQRILAANRELKKHARLQEGLVLSTCNRVEIYGAVDSGNQGHVDRVKRFLSEFHKVNLSDFEHRLYIYSDEDAVKHLFRVASGLDSMVLGEVEILGQVKKAYQDAVESRSAGKVLNRLLQSSFNTAKKVRTDTFIARGAVSVSSAAVRLARKKLGDLKAKKAIIIGTGEVSAQVMAHLKENGPDFILVANRTFEKAEIMADKFGARAVKFENFLDALHEADIVVASTGAPHCIIHRRDVLNAMPKRGGKPLFIIDLAVPRDVDPQVGAIANVHLYNIDDLKKIVDENLALRRKELENCQGIIALACRNFTDWLQKNYNL